MGDCKKLYDEDDPCEDREAQQGMWGKCHEFEPYENDDEVNEEKMENYTLLLRTANGLLKEGVVSARNRDELTEKVKQLERSSRMKAYAVLKYDEFNRAVALANEIR